MKVLFKKCEGEFMLFPIFNFDKWYDFTKCKLCGVITIGWLFWFIRIIKDK